MDWIPLEFDLFQWITVDYSGFKRNPLESTGKYSIWTGLEFLWTQNSSPFQLEFIPVKSENLADVECFSSSGFIPVEYSGIQLELVGDMKDLDPWWKFCRTWPGLRITSHRAPS